MLELDAWLASLGYPQYISGFKAAKINIAQIKGTGLTNDDLTAAGIKSKIHSKKILASASEKFSTSAPITSITDNAAPVAEVANPAPAPGPSAISSSTASESVPGQNEIEAWLTAAGYPQYIPSF